MTSNNLSNLNASPPFEQLASQQAVSPSSKRDLASWWKNFKKNSKKEEEKGESIGT